MTKNAFIPVFFKFYNMLWRLALPFLKKNKRLQIGFDKRTTSFHRTRADIWIQAASAGEAYLAVNIIKRLLPRKKIQVLATATTSQGIDILTRCLTGNAIDPLIDLKIDWFPFDCPDTIKAAVAAVNPVLMVLLETEIWPALLYHLKQNNTRIFVVNARLSQKSYARYMKTKFFWDCLSPDTILATSARDVTRYEHLFETAVVHPMSNIKFEIMDRNTSDADVRERIKNILPPDLPVTILASVRRQEEQDAVHILKDILKKFPGQVVALFPRHMHRIQSWENHLRAHGLTFVLRSGTTAPLTGPGIILWDTFGELQTAYGFASAVFVGGSLNPLGGQNFIEPAVQGAVTVTGPHYDDFAWAAEEIFKKGIVIKKRHWREVAAALVNALETPGKRSDQKRLAREYLLSHQGGTAQACHEILKAFDQLT